ncbi:MAG: hypothetical protein NW223_04860 [Hyphomicrobiaceae bacterium]|nr:hypothetical protein [Hyphomicrobiaceae bacterium]
MEGFDVKAAIDTAIAFVTQHYIWMLAAVSVLLLFSKSTTTAIRAAVVKALTDNWQLTLLASTGIALSLASAYTTFDGLRNFTSAPLLSVAIAFGIQGVMLIVAWLIGESFATGMNTQSSSRDRASVRRLDAFIGAFLGLMLTGLVFYWLLTATNAVRISAMAGVTADWARVADVSLYYLIGIVALALIAFGAMRGGELAMPYMQSIRLMVRNAVLWVMFIAAMSASVFFSFDSHFNAIFPTEQRARAAEIRATSQVGGVVADIGALAHRRQLEEAEHLFETPGWKAYDKQLSALAHHAQGAQGEIERFFVQKLEDRRRAIAQQHERIATAQSGQAGLANRKISLTEELSRLKGERPALSADYAQHQAELDAKAREIDAKRVEAMAEERGVEGTLKQGRGIIYRQRMAELATLQDQLKIKQERTGDAKRRLTNAEGRIAQIERELSAIDGDLAKMKGEAQTAEQRIRAAQQTDTDAAEGVRLDPARVLPAFEKARAAFRQQPTAGNLNALQAQCTSLLNAMSGTEATKERVRAIDCDPKQAAEAAARVFALNAGLAAFDSGCAGGDRLAKLTTTDALLGFGRRCLQDSGLVSKDSAEIGARLSAIDMNRDDKAHRFVVTWNAFLDGNRLAYLALILAVGVDSLVFMSGLFGAQALRSPLSDVPSPKARSAQQLEAIIEASLLPDVFKKARLAREAMHPMAPVDGFTNIVHLHELDPESQSAVRDVLNAGATIGAVREARDRDIYLVRAELYEFLCQVIRKELKARPEETRRGLDLDRLEARLREAMLPDVGPTAEAVLSYMHPIEARHGFTSEIRFDEVAPAHVRPVRNALTAGISLRVAQRDTANDHYFLQPDFYTTLSRIRAREMLSPRQLAARTRIGHGGQLGEEAPALLARPREATRAIPPPLRATARLPAFANGKAGQAMRETLQEDLLKGLRLPRAALAKLSDPEVARAALTAAQMLKRQTHSNALLREQIEMIESDSRRALEKDLEAVSERHQGDPAVLAALEEASEEIKQRLPALLLMPESGIMELLVEALEQGAGEDRLSADEQRLLEQLRSLKREIDGMDLASAAAWRNVQRQVEHFSGRGEAAQHQLASLTKH